MTKLSRLLLTTAVSALCLNAGGAFAQSSGSAPQDAAVVRGVVVTAKPNLAAALTATKTDTPVMETPLNVQVVTAETIEDQGAVALDQALRNVAGVTVGAGGAADNGQPFSSMFLRGFSTDAHFRNGVRLDSFGSDSGTESVQLANVDSIAVLKGPGAILYGAVEPGGIVNIVTRQPQATPVLSVEQQVGSYAFYRTVLDAGGPITADGKLLYRFDGSYEDSGSPTEFIYNRTQFLAPSVAWLPDAHDRITLDAEYRYLDFGQNFGFTPLNAVGSPVNASIHTNYGEKSPAHEHTFLVELRWEHQFNAQWSLRESTLLNNVRVNSAGIYPFYLDQPAPTASGVGVGRFINNVYGNDYTLSENLDLVGHFSTFGAAHTLLFGGDFVRFEDRGGINQAGQLDSNISYIDLFNPTHPGQPFNGPTTILITDVSALESAGIYLQDQIALPFDVHLLAGVRYQWIDQTSSFAFAGGPSSPAPELVAHAWTPRVGLLWQPRKWLSLYGNYTENFGPNNGYSLVYPGSLVPPTMADQWEVGAKTELFDRRLTASIDYFDLTKTNIPSPDPMHPNFDVVTGAARSRGVELDVQGQIRKGWSVVFNYAYDVAVVTKPGVFSVTAVPPPPSWADAERRG